MPEKKFKTYCCNDFPFLKLSSALKDEHGVHITIAFGQGTPGLYTARSAEEEKLIESRDWYGVKIFPFDQETKAEQATPVEEPGEITDEAGDGSEELEDDGGSEGTPARPRKKK